MELIGSKVEQDFRKDLLKSNEFLFSSNEGKYILDVLSTHYGKIDTAYILYWIPEQGEDLYSILVNSDMIFEVEISHDRPVCQIIKWKKKSEYLRKLSKMKQIKLAVALDLGQKAMGNG